MIFENYTITEKIGKPLKDKKGLFTPYHKKHNLKITVLNNDNGEKYEYKTKYQYNPTATKYAENDGLQAVLIDADSYVGTRYIENFMADFGYPDIKEAKKAFNACKKAFDFFLKCRINESKIACLLALLDN